MSVGEETSAEVVCRECGGDLAAEGLLVCLECAEELDAAGLEVPLRSA